jgi:hypothetical protein
MFLLLFTLSAWAAPIVVAPAPNAVEAEYRAYLAANPSFLTPTDALLRGRPVMSAREGIVHQFAQAQSALLQDSAQNARESFEQLLAQVHKEDWSEAEREALFVASLRRAQLAIDDTDRTIWIRWAISLNTNLEPDAKLFPPPLLKEYGEKLRASKKHTVKVIGLGSEWTSILINGVSCSSRQCPSFPDSELPVRITYLSDRWQPVTIIAPLNEISSHIPQRKAWVGGDCQKPTFDRAATLKELRPFFNMTCEEIQIGKAEINFQPTSTSPQAITMFEPPKKDRAFYKSPWLWAGVGTVVAILIVQSQQNKKEDRQEPSTTYGLQ